MAQVEGLSETMVQKIPCVIVTRPDSHGGLFCAYKASDFSALDEFDGAEEGERVVLTLKFMTEQELKDLPDFEGW